jgi:hypothetical protein
LRGEQLRREHGEITHYPGRILDVRSETHVGFSVLDHRFEHVECVKQTEGVCFVIGCPRP